MSQQKYRLVTRSDFDGLVCAVLLNELDALEQVPADQLLERRYRRLRGYGAYETAS